MSLSIESGLKIDPVSATESIVAAMRQQLAESFKRRGYVVAMSGGVDSSVCAALDSDDRILYNTATGDLLFDVDGNGVTAAVLIARLTSVPALTAVDFWVI